MEQAVLSCLRDDPGMTNAEFSECFHGVEGVAWETHVNSGYNDFLEPEPDGSDGAGSRRSEREERIS